MEMVKDKWYTLRSSNSLWLFKFSHIDNENIYSRKSFCISSSNRYDGDGDPLIDISSARDIKEVDIDTVLIYYPSEKKFKTENYEIF